MINSRAKGAKGERELAQKLKEYGFNCRRGQQYSGIGGDDVIGLEGVHIECKRVEALNLDNAMDQAIRDSKGNIPAVFHRKNNKSWKVTMELKDWIKLYNYYLKGGKDEIQSRR